MTNNTAGLLRYARKDSNPATLTKTSACGTPAIPSLRGATRRGNPDAVIKNAFDQLDCFATLAMTGNTTGLLRSARNDKQPQ